MDKLTDAPTMALTKDQVAKRGLAGVDVCPGMSTAFCMRCYLSAQILNDCPVMQDPTILRKSTHPCRGCELDCPCRNPPQELVATIKQWWRQLQEED